MIASAADELCGGLSQLSEEIHQLLNKAKKLLAESNAEHFVEHDIGCMFGMASLYSRYLSKFGVLKRAELDEAVQKNYSLPAVRDSYEELIEEEKDWDDFLKGLDKSLASDIATASHVLDKGEFGPMDMTVRDVRSGEERPAAVESLGGRFLVVSFGVREGAQRWLKETECPYDMVCDVERKLYKSFGIKKVVEPVWSSIALTYYGEQMACGRDLLKPYDDIHDDPHQMGGNVIIDQKGVIALRYRSVVPADRPTAHQILKVLEEISFKRAEEKSD